MLPAEREILSVGMHNYSQQYVSGKLNPNMRQHALVFCGESLGIFDRNRSSLPAEVLPVHEALMKSMEQKSAYDFMVDVVSKCCIYRC